MSPKFCIVLAVFGIAVTAIPYKPYNFMESTSFQRIIGGQPAPDRFAPHMVALAIGQQVIIFICGGSIVSEFYVLTAAHCLVLEWNSQLIPSFRGLAGSNNYTSAEIIIRFDDYKIHPDYDIMAIKNDIALLKTKEAIKQSERVAIIPLKWNWVGGGVKAYATGWGLTDDQTIPDLLQYLQVMTLSGQDCINALKNANLQHIPVDPKIEICTFHSVNHGMCNGDSGSALVLPLKENSSKYGSVRWSWEQIGIVSWGFPCAWGHPDFFVRVSAFRDFINPILSSVA